MVPSVRARVMQPLANLHRRVCSIVIIRKRAEEGELRFLAAPCAATVKGPTTRRGGRVYERTHMYVMLQRAPGARLKLYSFYSLRAIHAPTRILPLRVPSQSSLDVIERS